MEVYRSREGWCDDLIWLECSLTPFWWQFPSHVDQWKTNLTRIFSGWTINRPLSTSSNHHSTSLPFHFKLKSIYSLSNISISDFFSSLWNEKELAVFFYRVSHRHYRVPSDFLPSPRQKQKIEKVSFFTASQHFPFDKRRRLEAFFHSTANKVKKPSPHQSPKTGQLRLLSSGLLIEFYRHMNWRKMKNFPILSLFPSSSIIFSALILLFFIFSPLFMAFSSSY